MIPAGWLVRVVDEDQLRVFVQPLLLLVDDVSVLLDELADERADDGASERQPRDRPVEDLMQLDLRVGQWRQRRQPDDAMLAGDDVFDARARQLEADLGRDLAEEFVCLGIRRRAMPQHREAPVRRRELFGFLVHRLLRSPPPGAMHERAVSRVHQPDDRMVDRARKQAAFHEPLVRTIDVRDHGNLRQRIGQREFVFRHENPDVALHLATGKAAHEDSVEVKLLRWQQRWDVSAGSGAIESPAVIATFDLAAVEVSVAQRNAAMRADVAHREDFAVRVAAQQH